MKGQILSKTTCCYVQFFRRDELRSEVMESIYSFNLISILVVNILFFFSGICLNSLVIVSFWRSVQLRKKLCYFMIMVLSSCDLLVVLTNHLLVTSLLTMLWLTGKINKHPEWLEILLDLSNIVIGFSVFALFVMNFDQYLATHYPIFHGTSVTKRKLLILFAFLVTIHATVAATSMNNLVISFDVGLLIFAIIFIPSMLLVNYKLFTVVRKSRKNKKIPPEIKKSFSLKNISSCLLIVACLSVLSIPVSVYIGLRGNSKENENTLDKAQLAGLWTKTAASMNSTFNSLIPYWKNKTLRYEGKRVIESIKVCRGH